MEQSYGREELVFIKEETTFGTLVQPAGTDAIKVKKCDLGFAHERADILEKGSSRSLVNRVTRRKSATFTIDKYVRPYGTSGQKSDDSDLWKAVFGTETVNSGTSVVYTLAKEPSTSLTILRQFGPHQEAVCGAVPSKLSLTFGGGDEPQVSFSGEAKDHSLSGSAYSTTATSTSSDKVSVAVTDALQFCAGMKVVIGTDTNSGAGYTIESINYTTGELDLSTNVSSIQAIGSLIAPLAITPTTAGSVIPVTIGSVAIGSTTVYVTGGTFEIDQKVKMRNDEFGTSAARGFRHPECRDVSFSLDLYFDRGAAKWLNDAKRFTAQDIQVVLGSGSGCVLQIDANQVEFDIPKVSVPEQDEATISIAGKCLGTATGEDEISVTFR